MICNNCGNPLPENARFCGECGEPVMAETPAQEDLCEAAATPCVELTEQLPPETAESISQPEAPMQAAPAAPFVPAAAAMPAPTEPAPKEKRSHAGLIITIAAACVIVLGVLIAGLCTNWFRFDKQGPMDEIQSVCRASFPEDSTNGTANIRAKVGGFSFDVPVQFDIDRENPEASAVYADINIFGNEMAFGVYQGKLIIASAGFVDVEDIGDEIPGTGKSGMKAKNGEYDTESYFRSVLDEDEFEEFAEETDFDKLNEAFRKLEDDFNDEAWLTKYCGYTRAQEEDTVTYTFSLSDELVDEIKRIIRPAYKGEDDVDEMFENALEEVEGVLPLSKLGTLELVAVKGRLDKLVIGVEIEDQPLELEVTFDKLGKTEVDRDALQDLLDSKSDYNR